MFEKVNPAHPDKIADRIAGALVDLAYAQEENPKIAVEVLIGHGKCHIIAETSTCLAIENVEQIVHRIAGENIVVDYCEAKQDHHLAKNQTCGFRCGDNGIFKGVFPYDDESELTEIAKRIYAKYPTDGKYIMDGGRLIICQSNADRDELAWAFPNAVINPIGDWTGGTDVDTGAWQGFIQSGCFCEYLCFSQIATGRTRFTI